MKEQEKCPYCGAYLHGAPFYQIDRIQGSLKIWICQKCYRRVERWMKD